MTLILLHGHTTVSGGSLAPYFQTLLQMKQDEEEEGRGGEGPNGLVRHAGGVGEQLADIGVCLLEHRYLDETSCFAAFEADFGFPDVYAGAFIHVRKSSV